jgi:pimeloyl-ACP methyl ester carboxylesterase
VIELEPQHLTIHGHDVRYFRAGTGPAVLLVHGMAGSASTWKSSMRLLARDYTVIAPDLLGHGRSDKPRTDYSLGAFAAGLRDLLIATGIDRATVVGQSLGGGIAMQMAYQHPEQIERLVLVSSGGLGREVSALLRMFTFPGSEFLAPAVMNSYVRDWGNVVSRFLQRSGVRAPSAEEKWKAFASLCGAENRVAFIKTLRSVVDMSGQSVSAHDRLYLSRHLATLIIWGERDNVIPVEHAYAAHDAMPGSRLEIFEQSSHFPHAEEPERFAEVLRDFMESTEPAHLDAASWRAMLTDRAS